MYRITYPLKDTTLYENRPDQNTGIDQILEIRKFTKGEFFDSPENKFAAWDANYNSRILIKFDLSNLLNETDFNVMGSKHYLTLKTTEASALPLEYTLYAHPVSEDWTNGNGNFNDSPQIQNGASWKFKTNAQTADEWSLGTIEFTSVTGGGSWNNAYEATQSFSFDRTPDIRMDVTEIVNAWISGDIPNHGFILKHSTDSETNFEEYGELKFFSKETHTIYIPTLQSYWDTGTEYTGSFINNPAITDSFIVYAKNLKSKYSPSEKIRLRIAARDKYPEKSYVRNVTDINRRKLPDNTFFSIIDYVTKTPIIEFDTVGTRIKTDDAGHYIDLDFSNFLPVRYYKMLIKTVIDSREYIIENDINFRIE